MRTLATLLALGLLALAGAALTSVRSEDESPLQELEWLTGRWVMESDGQYLEETWSPARTDAMCGMFRWARNGGVWLYELMSIELEDDNFVFRLRHFDRGLRVWKSELEKPLTYPMVDAGDGRVVFEDPASDDVRRFVYERAGDRLTVRLEGAQGNALNEFRYRLEK